MADETSNDGNADLDALRVARDEARTTLDAQLAAIDDVDAKALSVFRLDVALVGVLVSALSFAATSDVSRASALVNPATGLGLALFATAAGAAGLTYTAVGQRVGVGPAGIDGTNVGSERAYLETLLDGYAEWIRANERVNVRKALLVTLSILGTVGGALALTVGAVVAFTGRWILPSVGAVLVLAAFVVLAGLPEEGRRLLEPPEERTGEVTPQSEDERARGQRTFTGPDREE